LQSNAALLGEEWEVLAWWDVVGFEQV